MATKTKDEFIEKLFEKDGVRGCPSYYGLKDSNSMCGPSRERCYDCFRNAVRELK